jgi:hypothetical protein
MSTNIYDPVWVFFFKQTAQISTKEIDVFDHNKIKKN